METISLIAKIKAEFILAVSSVKTTSELNDLKAEYLGKKGKITAILTTLSKLSQEEKKVLGAAANEAKKEIEGVYLKTLENLESNRYRASIEKITDPTLPSVFIRKGHLHPLYESLREISEIFTALGFDIAVGPEIETDYYNFQALNFPDAHPAKEMQDTFYVAPSRTASPPNEDVIEKTEPPSLLRTHTSPVQIRTMKVAKPPFKFIVPGRVYRHEALDASHSCVFHQVEGFCVDECTNLSDLKGVLELFVERFFKKQLVVRFRPSYFPFTEPSVEVDVECLVCSGKGCKVCKNSGYLEMLGAGMVHPNVLENCALDSDKWQGYAFGLGVERFAMLKYNIDDMRVFYKNNFRFIKQF